MTASSADPTLCIKVLNAAGGCISWRTCLKSAQKQQLAELQALFSGPGFSFETTPNEPDIPEGGYKPEDPQKRKIRFVANIT
ncbi:MAG: hypothetical protein ACR2PW_06445 [Gammaproteobacteria bacterium]